MLSRGLRPDGARPPDVSRAPAGAPFRPRARTTGGVVAGSAQGGVQAFKGVPYAAPPVGPLRFASPRPVAPWAGEREAVAHAASFPQPGCSGCGEDGLYANVWTPGTRGSRPVLVYVHGGGWFHGAGSEPVYDGAALAARGLVVVTFNYRLGVLGQGLHPGLADPVTGADGNWGLQDQAHLVRWVHENAPAFGGDPGNITLCGTSGGGAGVWRLSLLPGTRPLIRRAVVISAAHAVSPATGLTRDDAEEVFDALARELGTPVPGLREVPEPVLRGAWERYFAPPPWKRGVRSGRVYQGPVAGGPLMDAYDDELPTPGVPLLVVGARTEGTFFTGPRSPVRVPRTDTEEELRSAVRSYLSALRYGAPGEEAVRALVDGYREAARGEGRPEDGLSLYAEIYGDGIFRHPSVRLAERHAREGVTPLYYLDFAHPVLPPGSGTPHESTSPFLFGTYGQPDRAAVHGDGPLEQSVSRAFMDAVSSFARDGAPRAPGVSDWPVLTPGSHRAVTLGEHARADIAPIPKTRQLLCWDSIMERK
ncbi:carboxylesterase/lipase family protein [Streptomyces luteireticuli]|uniref:Carboxylic ester hydrolase n=1 Tax=Streptomyces luteireticuli TaxID=173858 RepID=A0ABN0YLG3_9ACTN